MALAPLPFLFCFPNRPVAPPTFGVTFSFLPAFPDLRVVVVVAPPVLVVVEVVLPVVVLPDPPPPAGALYSSSSAVLLQPGPLRSTRPSPSLSERSEHWDKAGAAPGPVVVRGSVPVPSELALPAATIARALPRAMMTRSFFLIFRLADPAREARGSSKVCRTQPPCSHGQGGRY